MVLGMVLLLATVAGAETHVGDWDVTGEVTASGNFATFGDSSYLTPFLGWSGNSRMVAVRQPNPVSSGVSSGFMFSNYQTDGNFKNIAQLMFLNEAIAGAEKRVAQILVTTGGTTVDSGKMYIRVYDGGVGTNALAIRRDGTIEGIKFPDGETQTTAFMGATGGGGDNTATGTDATVAGGRNNTASGNWYSTVGGGVNNTASNYTATVAGGSGNIASDSGATVGGGQDNTADGSRATVAGGGSNEATGNASTVGGGYTNTASRNYATVAGGEFNTASGTRSAVGGGYYNDAQAKYATIAGGGPYDEGNPATTNNIVTDYYGTIGGGGGNQAGDDAGTATDASYATVGGGYANTAGADYATVGGGQDNTATQDHATVSGGLSNDAGGGYATVGGGGGNTASADYATVGGGWNNDAAAAYATIAGGGPSDTDFPDTTNNVVTDDYGTIGGGGRNEAGDNAGTTDDAMYATVSGGYWNGASGGYATVAGGHNNTASADWSTVGGGSYNNASGNRATVAGGSSNIASGGYATVAGGSWNTASGINSLAAGYSAKASHNNSFVWNSGGLTKYSNGTHTFNIYASNGVWVNGGLHVASDRNKKENFEPVDSREVLEKVAALPMSTWSYKTEDGGYRHMGPMGQDFRAAFGLGRDEKHITTVDADGVALAAIQGLNQLVQEKDEKISAQQQQIDELREKLEHIQAVVEKSSNY
jgi:hypothetical protein